VPLGAVVVIAITNANNYGQIGIGVSNVCADNAFVIIAVGLLCYRDDHHDE
jgi:hypothetical protein